MHGGVIAPVRNTQVSTYNNEQMTKTLEKNQTEKQMISGDDIAPVMQMQENTTNQSDPDNSEKNQQQY